MGAANWLAGGVNRAVSGVRSALPGSAQVTEEQAPPARMLHAAPHPEERTTAQHVEEPAPARDPQEPAPAPDVEEPAPARDPQERTPAPAAQERTPVPAAQEPTAGQAAWSEQELTEFRAALDADIERLREELNMGQADLAELLDHNDPAGDDQADAGAQTLEREQEMSVAANARDLLEQSRHALHRLDAGTYGICESCGRAIPAARLRAFPRATLCIACKQLEERG